MKRNLIDLLLLIISILIIGLGTGKWLLGIIFCLVIYAVNKLIKKKK